MVSKRSRRIAADQLFRPEPLLFLLWALELARLAWDSETARAAGGLMMAAYVALSIARLRRATLWLCAPLAVLAAALAQAFGLWNEVVRGFESAAIFMAFFGSIVLLRGLADRRPEISRTRRLFAGLGEKETSGAFLVGAHVIGSILVVGVLAILASIAKGDAAARRRAAEASQRGLCLAPLWSPFWIASAFVARQIPGVPAWEIMTLGLALAATGLAIAHLIYARRTGMAELWRAVRGFAPLLPPVALCAAMIAGLSAAAGFGTLEALIATVPVLALVALVSRRGVRFAPLAGDLWRGAGQVRDEIVIVATALVLGRVLEGAASGTDLAVGALPSWGVIGCIVAAITIGSLVGVHQLVSVVVVLVVFAPLGTNVADVVMTEAALLGWAFASMVGVTAVSTATASAMFAIPRIQLVYGPNLIFVAVFGVISVALLTIVNEIHSALF